MKCPICTGVDLIMSDKQGIEIDYWHQCRGIWLDRGELDKIIERSNRQTAAPAYQPNHDRKNTKKQEESLVPPPPNQNQNKGTVNNPKKEEEKKVTETTHKYGLRDRSNRRRYGDE